MKRRCLKSRRLLFYRLSIARVFVDWIDTENDKTPDRLLFCRASAQDGDSVTRESDRLSTNQIPKSTKHQTDRPSVGRQLRTVSQIPETSCRCRLTWYRKAQNTRQIVLLSGVSPGRWLKCPRPDAAVDCSVTEKHKTPDRSPFCRVSAQDGIHNTRESASLSAQQMPETTKKHGYPFDLDSRILCALLTKDAAYIWIAKNWQPIPAAKFLAVADLRTLIQIMRKLLS